MRKHGVKMHYLLMIYFNCACESSARRVRKRTLESYIWVWTTWRGCWEAGPRPFAIVDKVLLTTKPSLWRLCLWSLLLFYMHLDVLPIWMSRCHLVWLCPWRPAESVTYPRIGVTDGRELPMWMLGIKPRSAKKKIAIAPDLWATSLLPSLFCWHNICTHLWDTEKML